MNTIQEALTSKRTLKKFLSECDFIFLSALNEQITAALTERKAEHEAQEQQRKERDVKRLELMELIKAEGFSPEELASVHTSTTAAKRKPKYQYIEGGMTKYWSGVGRVPVVIQQELDAGKPLESFLIREVNR
ncbi:H-NS family histone-like protein [Raoultella terrigena]|uniref:H-NS family histone-like protein n=1 Tax=Raoultella terrigena TaxID=577 RepID=UPI0005F831FA|nr:H-NS family nucleoid-associated regulatory protein [Raoultella terrigena]